MNPSKPTLWEETAHDMVEEGDGEEDCRVKSRLTQHCFIPVPFRVVGQIQRGEQDTVAFQVGQLSVDTYGLRTQGELCSMDSSNSVSASPWSFTPLLMSIHTPGGRPHGRRC